MRFSAKVDEPASEDEADVLFAMGEMRADELERCRAARVHLPRSMLPKFMGNWIGAIRRYF